MRNEGESACREWGPTGAYGISYMLRSAAQCCAVLQCYAVHQLNFSSGAVDAADKISAVAKTNFLFALFSPRVSTLVIHASRKNSHAVTVAVAVTVTARMPAELEEV